MTYENIAGWSQVIAMVLFGAVMLGFVVYAFRPGNKAKFDKAAQIPLLNDENENQPERVSLVRDEDENGEQRNGR